MKKTFLGIIALFMILALTACSSAADKQRIAELEAELSSIKEKYNITENDVSGNNESEAPTTTINEVEREFQEYLEENHVTLDNFDVQYDMANNLDKLFTISGVAELSDYYNWGFDKSLESSYFCLQVIPDGGGYTNRWYLYCSRESFNGVIEKAKKKGKIYISAVCRIPSSVFNKNQQCQAELRYIIY